MPPVRIRFGNVAANRKLLAALANNHRNMRSERALIGVRHKDDERVRAHESQGCSAVFVPEMFRNVHTISGLTTGVTGFHREPGFFCSAAFYADSFLRTYNNFSTSAITVPCSSFTSTRNVGSYFGNDFSFSRMSSS